MILIFFYIKYYISLDLVLLHCSKIPNIFRSISFSMFIWTSNVFLQNSPRQWPQAVTHSESMSTYVNRMYFLMMLYNCTGSFIWYQPQSSEFKHSRSKLLHLQTFKWTRKAWKCIALSDWGRFCCLRVKEFVTLSINLVCLSGARVSVSFP